jgi:hypothetical protein
LQLDTSSTDASAMTWPGKIANCRDGFKGQGFSDEGIKSQLEFRLFAWGRASIEALPFNLSIIEGPCEFPHRAIFSTIPLSDINTQSTKHH